MYIIKQLPEDFIVEEVPKEFDYSGGPNKHYLLKKKDYSTIFALRKISLFLNIKQEEVGYAGLKDRRAITSQMISIFDPNGKSKRLGEFQEEGIELTHKGDSKDRISLGDLVGNKFVVALRNLEEVQISRIRNKNITEFINYFGPQRFSTNNHVIGYLMIKRKFKEALDLIIRSRSFKEYGMESVIENNPNDAIGALRKLPKKVLMLYLHAYQSYLWNKVVKKSAGMSIEKIPLMGFGTEFEDEVLEEKYQKILDEDEVTKRDFIIRMIPEVSLEGDERRVFEKVHDFKIIRWGDDELNEGKKKMIVSFMIPKGAYATAFLDQLVG